MSNLRITAHTNEGPSSVNSTPEAPATCTHIPGTPEATKASKVPGPVKPSGGNGNTPPEVTSPNTLPAGYLSGGYYKGSGTGRYINPDLLDKQAHELAHSLAREGLKQSALNSVLRDLKKANKKTVPLEAKRGALIWAIPQAKLLVQRKRAPALLVDILERNRAAVETSEDYTAAFKHLTAVGVFLGDYQQ